MLVVRFYLYPFIPPARSRPYDTFSTFPHNIIKITRFQSKLLQDKKLNLSTDND